MWHNIIPRSQSTNSFFLSYLDLNPNILAWKVKTYPDLALETLTSSPPCYCHIHSFQSTAALSFCLPCNCILFIDPRMFPKWAWLALFVVVVVVEVSASIPVSWVTCFLYLFQSGHPVSIMTFSLLSPLYFIISSLVYFLVDCFSTRNSRSYKVFAYSWLLRKSNFWPSKNVYNHLVLLLNKKTFSHIPSEYQFKLNIAIVIY